VVTPEIGEGRVERIIDTRVQESTQSPAGETGDSDVSGYIPIGYIQTPDEKTKAGRAPRITQDTLTEITSSEPVVRARPRRESFDSMYDASD
jgi:hypothetical protein